MHPLYSPATTHIHNHIPSLQFYRSLPKAAGIDHNDMYLLTKKYESSEGLFNYINLHNDIEAYGSADQDAPQVNRPLTKLTEVSGTLLNWPIYLPYSSSHTTSHLPLLFSLCDSFHLLIHISLLQLSLPLVPPPLSSSLPHPYSSLTLLSLLLNLYFFFISLSSLFPTFFLFHISLSFPPSYISLSSCSSFFIPFPLSLRPV